MAKKRSPKPAAGTEPAKPYPVVGHRVRSLKDQVADLLFGHALRELRLRWQQETGKNWAAFCTEADISYSGYYNNEAGRAAIGVATLRRISRVLPIRVVVEHGEVRVERRDARGRYTPVEAEATGKVPEEG